jgi:putative phosphoesterase
MKIAVISDIHDNIWQLEKVLNGIAATGADVLFCCGDLCAPFTLKQISEGFQGPVHLVFGNNDGDKWLITTIATKTGNVTLHDTFFETELGGRQVAMVHFPNLGKALAASDKFDIVFYGHNHTQAVERVGETWWVNPGEVMGRFGRSTYAVYDTKTDEVATFEV